MNPSIDSSHNGILRRCLKRRGWDLVGTSRSLWNVFGVLSGSASFPVVPFNLFSGHDGVNFYAFLNLETKSPK